MIALVQLACYAAVVLASLLQSRQIYRLSLDIRRIEETVIDTGVVMTTSQFPEKYSYIPDYSMDAPDGHLWVRPVTDCPDCQCCTAGLCRAATERDSSCWHEGGGNQEGQHRLDTCPCRPLGQPASARLVEAGQ